MTKSKKTLTKAALIAAVLIIFIVLAECMSPGDRMDSGIPDVIRTRIQNEKCSMTVVANSGEIEDQEAFARRVICMYEANDFQTTKFSRDMGNTPRILDITVYLTRNDAAEEKEAFRFQYDMSAHTLLIF